MWWLCMAWAGSSTFIDFTDVEVRGELVQPDATFLFTVDRPYGEWSVRKLDRWERRLRRRGSPDPDDRVALAYVLSRLADHEELVYFSDLDGALDDGLPEASPSIRGRRLEALELLDGAPPDPEVLLAMAWLAQRVDGDPSGPLERLVEAHPEDPRAARALVELGQTALWEHDLTGAITRFAQVPTVDGAEPMLVDFARYMSAWCDYNLGRFDEARAMWRELADSAASPQLREEASRDLVREWPPALP